MPKKTKPKVSRPKKKPAKDLKKLQNLAKTQIKSFGKTASKEMGYAQDELAQLEAKAKEYIKKHPEKLFMAAAGIGAFVGALTATMIKRKGGRKK